MTTLDWQASPFPDLNPVSIERTPAELFCALALADPDAPVVLDGTTRTNRAELALRIGGLAERIAETAAPDGPVALLQSNGVDAVAAWFACELAGRPLLLLEPHNPPTRNAELIALAGATILLHDAGTIDLLLPRGIDGPVAIVPDGRCAPIRPDEGLAPTAPAFLFPTSGSTGTPKLVAYAARTFQAKLQASIHCMRIGLGDRVLIAGSHGNFGFVHHALAFMLAGGSLCLFDVGNAGLSSLSSAILLQDVGHVRFTPSLFRIMATMPAARPALQRLNGIRFSGEPLLWSDVMLARRGVRPDCHIQNVYGSTESAIFLWTDDRALPPGEGVAPIGAIYPGWSFAIVPDEDVPAAARIEGRLLTRSPHQALGDWNRGRIDGSRFPTDPAATGQRWFDTGDIVRQVGNGPVEMIGRDDRVVKVNGFRVGLAEVEGHLRAMPGCTAAAVVATERDGRTMLCGYFIRDTDAVPIDARTWLRTRLPAPMIPQRLHRMDVLPLLPGGKLDYRQLAALSAQDDTGDVGVPPPGQPEDPAAKLRAIWNAVLPSPSIGAGGGTNLSNHLDFFSRGGDSLRLLQLHLSIEQTFERSIPAQQFLQLPTLAGLAKLLGIVLDDDSVPRPPDGSVHFRRVRPGIAGNPVILVLPGIYGGSEAHILVEANAFTGFDLWACDAALSGDLLVDGDRMIRTAHTIAEAILAADGPMPMVLFGYSAAGYLAWLVDRMLPGRTRRIIAIDVPPLHRLPEHASPSLHDAIRIGEGGGALLLVRRMTPPTMPHPEIKRLCWTPLDRLAATVVVDELDHGAMGSAGLFAEIDGVMTAFAKGETLPDVLHRDGRDTFGAQVFAMLKDAAPPDPVALARLMAEPPMIGRRLALAGLCHLAIRHARHADTLVFAQRIVKSCPLWVEAHYLVLALKRASDTPSLSVPAGVAVLGTTQAMDHALGSRAGSAVRRRVRRFHALGLVLYRGRGLIRFDRNLRVRITTMLHRLRADRWDR